MDPSVCPCIASCLAMHSWVAGRSLVLWPRVRQFFGPKPALADGVRQVTDSRSVGHSPSKVQIGSRTLDANRASGKKYIDYRGVAHFKVKIGSRTLDALRASDRNFVDRR